MFGEKFRYAMARLMAGPFGAVTVVIPDGEKVNGHIKDQSFSKIRQTGGVLEIPTGGTAVINNKVTGERIEVDDWDRSFVDPSASVVISGNETILTPDRNTVLSPRGVQFRYHQEDES